MNDAPETPVPHDLCGQLIRHLNAMTDKSVTVFDIVHLLRERAYALLVLILALPNAVPGPFIPGLSTITGIPALIFAFEAALGRPHPRLPARVGKFKLNRAKMIGHLIRARPYTMNLETVMRPRLSAVSGRVRLAFLWCGWLALVLAMPIPFGNSFAAWALIILTLAIARRDGLFMLVGVFAGLLAIIVNIAIVVLGWEALQFIFGGAKLPAN